MFREIYLIMKADIQGTTYFVKGRRVHVLLLWVVFFFLLSFGYRFFLAFIFQVTQLDNNIPTPQQIYPLIVFLTYFSFITPLLSPIGQVLSEREEGFLNEILLSTPVSHAQVFMGRILASIIIFLPVYTSIGMLSFTLIIGDPSIPWIKIVLSNLLVIFLLVLAGIIYGSSFSLIIETLPFFFFIQNLRTIIGVLISLGLLLSVPFVTYASRTPFTETPPLFFMIPFINASQLILWGMYGAYDIPAFKLFVILGLELILGVFLALFLSTKISISPYDHSLPALSKTVRTNSSHTSSSFKTLLISYWKLTSRAPDFWSRVLLGYSLVAFIVYLFSTDLLFQDVPVNTTGKMMLLAFSLSYGGASLSYVIASGFNIIKKHNLAFLSSIPNGIILSQFIKTIILTATNITSLTLLLALFHFSGILPLSIVLPLLPFLYGMYVVESLLLIAIYSIQPVSSEEDLRNLVNIGMFFFLLLLPITAFIVTILRYQEITFWSLWLILSLSLVFSLSIWLLGIKSLDQIDTTTWYSPLGYTIKQLTKVALLWLFTFGVFPLVTIFFIRRVNAFFLLVIAQVSPLIPYFYYITIRKQDQKTKQSLVPNKTFAINLSLTGILLIIMLGLALLITFLASLLGYHQLSILGVFTSISLGYYEILSLLVITTIVEELIYRQFFYELLRNRVSFFVVAVFLSFLFSLTHFLGFLSLIHAFFQSLILFLLREKTKSVWYPLLAHLSFNLLLFSLL